MVFVVADDDVVIVVVVNVIHFITNLYFNLFDQFIDLISS